MLDVLIHYVDVLRRLFGDTVWVNAMTPQQLNQQMQGEDVAAVVFRFGQGQVATMEISWSAMRIGAPHLELLQPGDSTQCYRRADSMLPLRVHRRINRLLPQYLTTQIRVNSRDLSGATAIMENIIHAITLGRNPAVSGEEYLKDLRVIKAAYRSLASQQAVELPSLSDN